MVKSHFVIKDIQVFQYVAGDDVCKTQRRKQNGFNSGQERIMAFRGHVGYSGLCWSAHYLRKLQEIHVAADTGLVEEDCRHHLTLTVVSHSDSKISSRFSTEHYCAFFL